MVNEYNKFIKRPVNKLHPLQIQTLNNSVVKNTSENNDVINYGRSNGPKQLSARETLIWRLNKQK